MTSDTHILDLITRLARLESAQAWEGDLNPAQRAILGYLAKANRFSRSPSHVANYLGSTRGTATQSLKSLLQKGYVTEHRSQVDKRVISFELTHAGQEILASQALLETALGSLGEREKQTLAQSLQHVLRYVLAAHRGREFGLCKTCKHHQYKADRPFCALLQVALSQGEGEQICHEQVSA